MREFKYAMLTTMCVLFKFASPQSIYSMESHVSQPIHEIPIPRPAPQEIKETEIPIITETVVTTTEAEPEIANGPITTTFPTRSIQLMAAPRPRPSWKRTLDSFRTSTTPATTLMMGNSYGLGYFISKEQLLSSTEPALEKLSKNGEEMESNPQEVIPLFEESSTTLSTTEAVQSIGTELPKPLELSVLSEAPEITESVISTDFTTTNELSSKYKSPATESYVTITTPVTTPSQIITTASHEQQDQNRRLQLMAAPRPRPYWQRTLNYYSTTVPNPSATEKIVLTASDPTLPSTTLKPTSCNAQSVAVPKPLLVKPLPPPPTTTQKPVLGLGLGRSPIVDGDDGEYDEPPTDRFSSKPVFKEPVDNYEPLDDIPNTEHMSGNHFVIHDTRKDMYPVSTTTNIAIFQGPSSMTCTEKDFYYTIENECEYFIECRRKVATKYMCPDGLYFNKNTSWPLYPCSYPSEVQCTGHKHEPKSSGECPRQYGFFPLANGNCGKYLMCQEGKATIMNCPPGLAFNPEKDSCDWPINVPSCEPDALKGFICPAPPHNEDGTLSDIITHLSFHGSCKQYVACQLGHPRLLSCDLGYSYDASLGYCNESDYVEHCKNVE